MYCTKSTDSTMPKLLSLVINQEKRNRKKTTLLILQGVANIILQDCTSTK